jgi:hypothetical protein
LENKSLEAEWGKFYSRKSSDAKLEGTWIILCDPCKKEMKVNLGVSYNLKIFEIHLDPRKTRKFGGGAS